MSMGSDEGLLVNNESQADKALKVLKALFAAYDELCERRQTACAAGCAVCCSDRVLLTGLEGFLLVQALKDAGRDDLVAMAASKPVQEADRPRSTFNALARLCMAQEEPPYQEQQARPAGSCPLLADGLCSVYQARPLACRSMASLERCRPGGQAVEESFWVSLNSAFFQLVEQCSLGMGGFGLLPQVLASLLGDEEAAKGLLKCEPLPGLVVPPEDQAAVQDALRPVFNRLLEGRPLGIWLDELRREAGY
jgi:Fe-S-cluster containining protein